MREVYDTVAETGQLVRNLCQFLWRRRLWWLVPIIAIMLLVAALIVLAETSLASLIYTLF